MVVRRLPPVASLALLGLAAAAAACGRSGYDGHTAFRDGAPGGDGGATADASHVFDGSLPVDCLVVTTGGDEEDAGEVPTPPHLGGGLSLREAITLANATGGGDCIRFDDAVTAVSFAAVLPAIDDDGGLLIDGARQVSLGGGAAVGLTLASAANTIRGLEITGVDTGVLITTGAPVLRDLHIHGNDLGIRLEPGAGADLGPCLIHDNGGAGIHAQGSVDLSVRHCTIANNQASGIDATVASTGLLVLSSIVAENGDPGIQVDDQTSVDTIDFSAVADNQVANCQTCTLGTNTTTQSPMFTDPALEDYTLLPGSPAIDTGTDVGFDRNGGAAGDSNGRGPDMGYHETAAL